MFKNIFIGLIALAIVHGNALASDGAKALKISPVGVVQDDGIIPPGADGPTFPWLPDLIVMCSSFSDNGEFSLIPPSSPRKKRGGDVLPVRYSNKIQLVHDYLNNYWAGMIRIQEDDELFIVLGGFGSAHRIEENPEGKSFGDMILKKTAIDEEDSLYSRMLILYNGVVELVNYENNKCIMPKLTITSKFYGTCEESWEFEEEEGSSEEA